MTGTRGVTALAQVLARLVDSSPLTAAELAEAEGLPRSSVFDIVRRLQQAGFVARGEGGRLAPGDNALRLGFAAHGAQALCGPAEVLLRLLRDGTDGTAALLAGDVVLLRLAARWEMGDNLPAFVAPLGAHLCVSLTLRHGTTRAARSAAETMFHHVATSLKYYLMETAS